MLNSTIPLVPDLLASTVHTVELQHIIRAIASSTAIETGQSIQELEALLQSDNSFFPLELAAPSLA